jgi:integrase
VRHQMHSACPENPPRLFSGSPTHNSSGLQRHQPTMLLKHPKRLRTVITDKKLTMHSLRHRMKDKLRNTGCPEAISMAILGHSTNTVAANYGSGYALGVMRENLEKTWT